MELTELWQSVPEVASWNPTDKIKLFGWYLHQKGHERFRANDVLKCFDDLHLGRPSNTSAFLRALVKKRPPQVLEDGQGFRLEATVRARFDEQYGKRPATVHVDRLLTELPEKVPNISERGYLEEALICFRHKAFRASVVMCWNLAFDHLCEFVLAKHLSAFNTQLPKSYPKADISTVNKRDDFAVLKESQVLQVCSSANIISGSVYKILKEKLDRRNVAAHPSAVATFQPTAEEYIKDLVENVVLKLV